MRLAWHSVSCCLWWVTSAVTKLQGLSPAFPQVLQDVTDKEMYLKIPSTAASLLERDEESQENQNPLGKKRKKMLNSNISFFSGCTPIREGFN